jgi:hypothetical protein
VRSVGHTGRVIDDESGIEDVAALFLTLAGVDFLPGSLYQRLAREAAEDHEVLALMLPARPNDRLPHLLFAAVQYLLLGDDGDPLSRFGDAPYSEFRAWCLDRRDELTALIGTHVVQTNEVARCAGLLPCLSAVAAAGEPGRPLALVEPGCSAGMNLLFDHYRYDYGNGHRVGPTDSPVLLTPQVTADGPVPPLDVPEVVWRRGLDRRPVDLTDDDSVRWLRSCVWPEQTERRHRFEAAVDVARRSGPPELVQGDALDALGELIAEAPADATLVILHTAFIAYLPQPLAFGDKLAELAKDRPLWWVSGEPPGPIPALRGPLVQDGRLAFVYGIVPVGIDGQEPRVFATSDPHGIRLRWPSLEEDRTRAPA